MKRRRAGARIAAALIVAFAMAAAGCGRGRQAGGGAAPPVPVQVATATSEDVPRQIDSIGSVQALRSVAVKSQVDGVIAEIHFREGDEVKEGDLLVGLDRRPFENSLRMARADLTNAQAEAKRAEDDAQRYQRLGEEQAISKEQLATLVTKAETTRALVQAKLAAVANAELELGYTAIRAPISGRTGQLLLHEGALVKGNDVAQSIVSINQIAPISVAYNVPEPWLADVRAVFAAGQARVAVIDRAGEVERAGGRLDFIDNSVDATTGTITLKAVFDNHDHALWPGQFVHVHTRIGLDRGATVVPTSAVMTGQNGSQVFVVKSDDTVELRPVKTIRTVGDRTLVAEGVKAGEVVVSDGQLRLVPGTHVSKTTLAAFAPGGATPAPVATVTSASP